MKIFDLQFISGEIKVLAGCDEAGRGPLAGPVVAASVIFHNDFYVEGINDSKQLTSAERNELFDVIVSKALACSVACVSHGLIDRINILNASLFAMRISVSRLSTKPDIILIDGNRTFEYPVKVTPIVKGDSKSFTIAAASILAKVTRDRIMKRLDRYYPQYGWKDNKGYPTKKHLQAIRLFGETSLHRKTFLRKFYERELNS